MTEKEEELEIRGDAGKSLPFEDDNGNPLHARAIGEKDGWVVWEYVE